MFAGSSCSWADKFGMREPRLPGARRANAAKSEAPRQHEPRNPHADERHPRNAQPRAQPTFWTCRSIAGVARLFEGIASAKGLQLHVSFEDVPEIVVGDETRIRQVLLNLVSNAVKFTEAGSVTLAVTGEARAAGDMEFEVSVRDTGIGIPMDRQSALFGKFSQVDGSTTRRYGGTGLGLSIAKSLVILMRGTIGVTSTVGEGSCFRITIPVALPTAHEQRSVRPDRNRTLVPSNDRAY